MTGGMKKTHWLRTTLIVLILCGLAGAVLAAVLFGAEGNRTYAAATLQFSFDGSADGKAPNGYPFDVTGLTTDEVLGAALEASGLAGTYTPDQLRENLVVTGVYPEKIAEQMTKYVSLLDAGADTEAEMTDYHATQYSVVLYNDFDKTISTAQLTALTENILTAYRAYFAKTYAANLDAAYPIENIDDYDYAQRMEAIAQSVNQQIRYAQQMKTLARDFRTENGSFGDIVTRYENLKNDISRMNATITLNAVSKDRDRLRKRYETEIRELGRQLDSLTDELKQIEEQISAYDKDGIIYVSANGELTMVGGSSGTYDQLVEIRKQVTDNIAETNAQIALLQERLNDLTGDAAETVAADEDVEAETAEAAAVTAMSEEDIAALTALVDERIGALRTRMNAVRSDFIAMLDAYSAQEINEKTVSFTAVKIQQPKLISGAFIKKVIKTAGPLCAVGLMVCLVMLIRARRKEQKAG